MADPVKAAPKRGAAAAPTPAPQNAATPTLDPEKQYKVELSRPLDIAGHRLFPRHKHRILGSAIMALSAEDRAAVTVVE
jgi:hypothetical protein